MKLQRCMVFSPNSFQPFNPLFAVKEFCVQFYRLAHRRTCLDIQLIHARRDKVGAIFFTELLNIQQPIILWISIREGIINQVVPCEVIVQKHLFHGKVVRPGELDDCYIRDVKLIKHSLELSILVLPEDDPPLIELRQRGGKTFSECKLNRFYGHNRVFLSWLRILYIAYLRNAYHASA